MNKWALFGSLTLIAGAVGHFIIVDLSVWILQAGYVQWLPSSLLEQMKATSLDWGVLGKQNFMHIFSGFSLWLVPSLTSIAIFNILIFKNVPIGHKLRYQALVLSLIISIVFTILSALCFIYPPMIGGILAMIFFTLAIKKEKNGK